MADVILFLVDLLLASIVTVALTWLMARLGRLLPGNGGDPPPEGEGGWRYRPRGPRDDRGRSGDGRRSPAHPARVPR